MSQRSQKVTFKAGTLIIQERMKCDALYIIDSGQVEIYKIGKNDQRLPLGVIGSGEYLGEMALISGSNHSASALALTDVVALKLSREAIEEQFNQAPQWLISLARGLASRLATMNNFLLRHNVVDESLMNSIAAIQSKHQESPPFDPEEKRNADNAKTPKSANTGNKKKAV